MAVCLKTFFPYAWEQISKQVSIRAHQALWSKEKSEWCEKMSKQTSEWPNTYSTHPFHSYSTQCALAKNASRKRNFSHDQSTERSRKMTKSKRKVSDGNDYSPETVLSRKWPEVVRYHRNADLSRMTSSCTSAMKTKLSRGL